jgi:predicted AlkP superfamily phosphohydrolase/phosphomutase
VNPGPEREALLAELIAKLEAVRDVDGRAVIRKVHRSDEVYSGAEMKFAPDLIIGYHRGYRCSWATSLGDMTEEVLSDNTLAWSADHCLAAEDVPGILLTNRPIQIESPGLVDLAPTILAEYGVDKPTSMVGRSIFESGKAV